MYWPTRLGSATHAGPGLEYSAAIGPRRLVGVHGLCLSPPILLSEIRNTIYYE